MVTSKQCLAKYNDPSDIVYQKENLIVWQVPKDITDIIHTIPQKIYCNRDLISPLEAALRAVIAEGVQDEIKTWDGCWNIRKKRGQKTMSLHSWGIAIDINASDNCFGCPPKMSEKLVSCFTRNGFDWGGIWSKPDGMHFQLSKI